MKKIFSLIPLFFAVAILHAQITVTAVPPGPRFMLDDLWQLTLVKGNTSVSDEWLNISLTVYDEGLSKILTASTKRFQFGKRTLININQANLNSYEPIDVQYFQKNFKSKLASNGGTFPAGIYKVEVSCNLAGEGFTEPLGKYIYNITSELMMPIQLISVYNNDTIEEENPMFNWIPPYPLPAGNISYEFELTEIKPNETPISAIGRNQPLLKTNVLNQNSLFYSTNTPQLIPGKEYAWHVNAYLNGNYLSGSETWRFVYDFEEDTMNYEPEQYFAMLPEINNSYVIIDSNLLPISFIEDYSVIDSIASINLFNKSFDTVATETELPIYIKSGTNYCYLNFCPEVFELENGLYILEVALMNGRKFYLKFKNISAPDVCFE